MANVKIKVDELAANGNRISVENNIGYDEPKLLSDLGDNDLITKSNLTEGGVSGSDFLILAGSAYPAVLVNGTDFNTTSLHPIVGFSVIKDSVTDTTNGTQIIVDYNFATPDKDTLVSITVWTNSQDGITVEQDTWVRIV